MTDRIRHVGLDVHKDTVTVAVAESAEKEKAQLVWTIPNETLCLLKPVRRSAEDTAVLS